MYFILSCFTGAVMNEKRKLPEEILRRESFDGNTDNTGEVKSVRRNSNDINSERKSLDNNTITTTSESEGNNFTDIESGTPRRKSVLADTRLVVPSSCSPSSSDQTTETVKHIRDETTEALPNGLDSEAAVRSSSETLITSSISRSGEECDSNMRTSTIVKSFATSTTDVLSPLLDDDLSYTAYRSETPTELSPSMFPTLDASPSAEKPLDEDDEAILNTSIKEITTHGVSSTKSCEQNSITENSKQFETVIEKASIKACNIEDTVDKKPLPGNRLRIRKSSDACYTSELLRVEDVDKSNNSSEKENSSSDKENEISTSPKDESLDVSRLQNGDIATCLKSISSDPILSPFVKLERCDEIGP